MKRDRNDRSALKQLGIGFSGEFTGKVSAIGRTFKKQGILYTVICLTQVHEINSKETVCHVWFDILYSDLETFNLNKGDKIVLRGTIHEYERKDGTSGIGIKSNCVLRKINHR